MSYYQELKEAAERCRAEAARLLKEADRLETEAANLPVVKAEEEK